MLIRSAHLKALALKGGRTKAAPPFFVFSTYFVLSNAQTSSFHIHHRLTRLKIDPLSYHIALGSNLDDRMANLQYAVEQLGCLPGGSINSVSPVYESAAHVMPGAPPQPAYLNAVLHIQTSLQPRALLRRCLNIESARGRNRKLEQRWQARTLDIDLLCCSNTQIDGSDLTLPHPRIAERLFVLLPLSEIDMDLHIPPPFDRNVRYLLEHCPDQSSIKRSAHILKVP
ncbi:MAG: 2-amino-4-hydroxy-6-hydroxymethyldihydropteridine diphosphokinase [Rhodothermales bacterium]|nr:2-amino-4-hydroxy-6-hydroxymethyldihydropteridine diphosphokinase [Rhodothermales bacterium]